MKHSLIFLLLLFSLHLQAYSQQLPNPAEQGTDSIPVQVPPAVADSIPKPQPVNTSEVCEKPKADSSWLSVYLGEQNTAQLSWKIAAHHPYFGFSAPLILEKSTEAERHRFVGKEWLFYFLLFLLILYALLKNAFPKYFSDLFRVFFRTTLKQRQISEQLAQTPLPSLLLNGFFIINGGLYIAFLFAHYTLDPAGNFWLLFLYASLGISGIYFIKFIWLKTAGWLFGMQEVAEAYIFVVFVINKMIGIVLLPFLILLAFTQAGIYTASLTLSWCLLGGLILYRVILTYITIRNQVSVNPFHFFLYLSAFEIAPLLLIYKALLEILRITA